MTLVEIADELKKIADEFPLDPLRSSLEQSARHRRVIDINGRRITIMFTRTKLARHELYQLSLGAPDNAIMEVSDSVIREIVKVFLDSPTEIRSVLGNTRQFVQMIG